MSTQNLVGTADSAVGGRPAGSRREPPARPSLDGLLTRLDRALRTVCRVDARPRRPLPGAGLPGDALDSAARRHAAGLMRVNHAGEVCAQALYVGQAVLARDSSLFDALLAAAGEEGDHLDWCEHRLHELDAAPSRLNPAWFLGSFLIGLGAAALSDRLSLGFVEETEHQVVRHLEGHLAVLPENDARSRAIVAAMRDDEARHARDAADRGAAPLPALARRWMALNARVMTTFAYRL